VPRLLHAATEFYIAEDFHEELTGLEAKLERFWSLRIRCLQVNMETNSSRDTALSHQHAVCRRTFVEITEHGQLNALEDVEMSIDKLIGGFALAEHQDRSQQRTLWTSARQRLGAVRHYSMAKSVLMSPRSKVLRPEL
jgi:hypothetical protein